MTTDAHERRYHVAMARMCVDRGFLNLAESHLVSAKDCPRGCGCSGCESTARDREEEKARKAAVMKRAKARRIAAEVTP